MGQTVENPTYELDLGDGVEGVEVNIDGNDANLVETSVTAGLGSDAEGQPVDESAKEEKPAAQADQKDGEELKDYSESVKKRIDKLTSKLREAERREQAAIEFAQGVQQKFLTAEQSVAKANLERLGEAKSRVETQMMTIKQIIKKAREEGDIDTETEAQERLMSLMHEQREIGQYLDQPQRSVQQPPAQPQQFQQQQQFQQPVQQAARPDSKAEEWAEQNPWFGQDYAMTYAAWGIDKQLREAEGFDGSSDEYYDELNRRIRGQFPQKFAAQTNRAPKQNVQAVAPAARSSGVNNSARRSVKLSPSQVAIAKKLGVPVEEYAKYVKE